MAVKVDISVQVTRLIIGIQTRSVGEVTSNRFYINYASYRKQILEKQSWTELTNCNEHICGCELLPKAVEVLKANCLPARENEILVNSVAKGCCTLRRMTNCRLFV